MSGVFNVTTIPRAIFLGFILMFFALNRLGFSAVFIRAASPAGTQ